MKQYTFVLFAFTCLLTIFQCTPGVNGRRRPLKCYKCAHVSGVDPARLPQNRGYTFDESCKSGSTPTANFLYTCDSEYPGEDTVCAKLKISTYSPFDNAPVEIIARQCLPANLVKKDCNKITREDLAWLPGMPSGIIKMIPQNPEMTMCTCTSSKCNGASAAASTDANRIKRNRPRCHRKTCRSHSYPFL